MRVLVSNPSFQYSLHTVKALQHLGHDVYFATTYWFNENRWLERFIYRFCQPTYKKLVRKQDIEISEDKTVTSWSAVINLIRSRILYKTVEERSFNEDRYHDRWVARWVSVYQPNMVIGYEKSCLKTFEAVKKYKGTCYLDLAQVHPNCIRNLRLQYDFFRSITGSDDLFTKVSNLKEEEYKLADTILCLSEFAKKTLLDSAIDEGKVFVNPLGFDPSIFFQKNKIREANDKPIAFIYAGIITKRKGINDLVEIFKEIESSHATLTIVGPRGDASYVFKQYRNASNIRYINSVSQKELASLFRDSDVFIFSSYLDSWAAVIPEAMACGLPIITTNSVGAAEIVSSESGFVVDAGNIEQLKKAIQFFIDNPASINKMGKVAIRAAGSYTWQTYQQRLQALIATHN